MENSRFLGIYCYFNLLSEANFSVTKKEVKIKMLCEIDFNLLSEANFSVTCLVFASNIVIVHYFNLLSEANFSVTARF